MGWAVLGRTWLYSDKMRNHWSVVIREMAYSVNRIIQAGE